MKIEGKRITFRHTLRRSVAAAMIVCANQLVGISAVCAADGDDTFPSNATVSVASLPGVDPSADMTSTGRPQDDNSKIFCLYNEGTKKFLNIGGLWGTHASISDVPYSIWFEKTSDDGVYYLNNNVAGSGTGTYVGINKGELHMDTGQQQTYQATFVFEKAEGYSDANKLYTIKVTENNGTGSSYYITTYPDNENKFCNIQPALYATTDSKYNNQVWKIISKKEYYTLFLANPANMAAAIDATFLITSPSFRVNDTDMSNWKLGTDQNPDLRFGDAQMYCTYAKRGTLGQGHFNSYDGTHQQDFGKYFYCYSVGSRGYYLYQDVKVHKSGWYLVRCNGFSTSNSMENIRQNGKPLAHLFCTVLDASGEPQKTNATSSTLNVMSQEDADALQASDSNAGIGKAFFEGGYENQVQLCIDKAADGNEIS